MPSGKKPTYMQIHPQDNVLVALQDLEKGQAISFQGNNLTLAQAVAAKHKFTLNHLAAGAEIFMYGVLVGKTTEALAPGRLITTENLKHAAGDYARQATDYAWQAPDVSKWLNRTFLGYHRADGQDDFIFWKRGVSL